MEFEKDVKDGNKTWDDLDIKLKEEGVCISSLCMAVNYLTIFVISSYM